jgi:hypothetical protein
MKRLFALFALVCLLLGPPAQAALMLADRVQETSTTTGTGPVTLDGTMAGYRTFAVGVGDGNTTYYAIVKGSDWEVGIGTVTVGPPATLSRTTILSSSAGGAAVNFGSGPKNVFVTVPGSRYPVAASGNACSATNADTTHFLRGDCTWQTIPGGGDALTTSPLSQFVATTSAQLGGVLSDETGSGLVVYNTSPSLVTPILGDATGTSVSLFNNLTLKADNSLAGEAVNLDSRKSRGTVGAPSVLTSGDFLAKLRGFGYVGPTNTFVEAAEISMQSTGTIADTTTGIGGIISFKTATVGGALTEVMNITGSTINIGTCSTQCIGTAEVGTLQIDGSSSGLVTQVAQAAAGTPTVTWGTSSGTPAVTASSPLSITASTGNILCATCTTNAAALTSNLPMIGAGGQAAAVGTVQGNTTKFVSYAGSAPATNDCAKFDASGNLATNGAACGGGGGSTALSALTAATGSNTIASGNNSGQAWNWALTTDSTIAWTLGETTAATGGTVTSGIPNQMLAKFSTLASSTASPLEVYVRGTYAGGFSSTSAQYLAGAGTCANPPISFAADAAAGWFRSAANVIQYCAAGSAQFILDPSNGKVQGEQGSATTPGYGATASPNDGISWSISTNSLSVLNNALETVRWDNKGRQYFRRQTSVPTMGACGTSPSVTIGTDNAMVVTVGTGGTATDCTVTFGATFLTNAPPCVANSDTDMMPFKVVRNTTNVTITAAAPFTASSTINVICIGAL